MCETIGLTNVFPSNYSECNIYVPIYLISSQTNSPKILNSIVYVLYLQGKIKTISFLLIFICIWDLVLLHYMHFMHDATVTIFDA